MRTYSLGFLLGSIAILNLPYLLSLQYIAGCALLLSITIMLMLKWPLQLYQRLGVLCLCGCLSAVLYTTWQAKKLVEQRFPSEWEQRSILVTGYISDLPSMDSTASHFRFQVQQASMMESTNRLSWQGALRVSWYHRDGKPPPLSAGDQWQFIIRAKQPSGLVNQQGFDKERWLFSQGIAGTAYVRNTADEVVHNRFLAAAPWWWPDYWREQLRQALQQVLADSPVLGLVQGLAIADRSAITTEQWQWLRRTGTNHLLAISGLHIGMVAGLGFLPVWLLSIIWPSLLYRYPLPLLAAIMGVVLATAYALLAGFSIPTQRAWIMVVICLWGLLHRHTMPWSVTLIMALLLVLLLDPLASLSVGFWLSFGAVALLSLIIQRQFTRPRFYIVVIQLYLSLAMLPLTALFFASVSFIAPVANLIAIPWVSILVVPVILLGVLAWLCYPPLAALLWQLAAQLLLYLQSLLHYLSEWPWASWSLPALPWYWLGFACLGVVLYLLPKGIPGRWLALLLLLPLLSYQVPRPALGSFVVNVLDVGQGSATMIRTTHHNLLMDTGSQQGNIGAQVIVPWLQAKGIQQLSKLMISHADTDHSGGASFILENMQVAQLQTNAAHLFPAYSAIPCVAGEKWQWDGVQFAILYPQTTDAKQKENNTSCVLRVSQTSASVLLTGDIEREAEFSLLQRHGTNLASTVLIVPHHGSKTSSTASFLSQVQPQLAIISSGYGNRYRHPAPVIVKRYAQYGIPLIDTQESGEIELLFNHNQALPTLRLERKSNQGIWRR